MQEELPTEAKAISHPRESDVTAIAALPAPISAWLHAEHEQLAKAIAHARSEPELSIDGDAMLAVDDLPEATKRFLWRGMQRHHPGLSELVRDPLALEMRATFGARWHLRVSDLVQVICASAPTTDSLLRPQR